MYKICNFSKKIIIFLLLISNTYSSENAQAPVVKVDPLETSITELEKIQDKDSSEYQVMAYKVAIDTINSGKEALASYDSARALKLLSLAARFLPWRGDIVNLRDTALETYIKVSNSIIDKKKCDEIFQRTEFLKTVAPDGVIKLQDFPAECKIEKMTLRKAEESISNILLAKTPIIYAEIEKENFTDLKQDLNYIVKRNNNFPYDDFFKMQMSYLFEFWKDFSFSCANFSVDPNATSLVDFNMNSNCSVDASFHPLADEEVTKLENKYISAAEALVGVPNGEGKIEVSLKKEIQTTKPLMESYDQWYGSHYLSNGDIYIFDVILENKNGAKVIRQTGFNLIKSAIDGSIVVVARFGEMDLVPKTDGELAEYLAKQNNVHSRQRNASNDFEMYMSLFLNYPYSGDNKYSFRLPGMYKFNFSSQQEIEGLKKISFKINLKKTYEFHEYVHKHRKEIMNFFTYVKSNPICNRSDFGVVKTYCQSASQYQSNKSNFLDWVKRLVWYSQGAGIFLDPSLDSSPLKIIKSFEDKIAGRYVREEVPSRQGYGEFFISYPMNGVAKFSGRFFSLQGQYFTEIRDLKIDATKSDFHYVKENCDILFEHGNGFIKVRELSQSGSCGPSGFSFNGTFFRNNEPGDFVESVISSNAEPVSLTPHPGFDCAKASSNAEKLICKSTEVSALDKELSETYADILKNVNNKNDYKKAQSSWIKEKRDKCGDEICLKNVYSQRLQELKLELKKLNGFVQSGNAKAYYEE